jgi:hypothetical protein
MTLLQVVLVGCLGSSMVFEHLGGPPGFPGVEIIVWELKIEVTGQIGRVSRKYLILWIPLHTLADHDRQLRIPADHEHERNVANVARPSV